MMMDKYTGTYKSIRVSGTAYSSIYDYVVVLVSETNPANAWWACGQAILASGKENIYPGTYL